MPRLCATANWCCLSSAHATRCGWSTKRTWHAASAPTKMWGLSSVTSCASSESNLATSTKPSLRHQADEFSVTRKEPCSFSNEREPGRAVIADALRSWRLKRREEHPRAASDTSTAFQCGSPGLVTATTSTKTSDTRVQAGLSPRTRVRGVGSSGDGGGGGG